MSQAARNPRAYPVEEFLQALTAQLDRAQDALALKVQGTNRPLTWALKDLNIDLRVFVEVNDAGKVLLRSAGPNEDGASTVHLNLTTITRPMVEENSYAYHTDSDPRGVDQIASQAQLSDDDQRRLEWMGVRTVGQLKQLDPMQVQTVIGIPVARLQAALEQAARPIVSGHRVLAGASGVRLIGIDGANLTDGTTPEVHLSGEPVEVISARPRELVVRPADHHREGPIEVFTQGQRVTGFFRIKAASDAAPGNGTRARAGREPASAAEDADTAKGAS